MYFELSSAKPGVWMPKAKISKIIKEKDIAGPYFVNFSFPYVYAYKVLWLRTMQYY